MVMGDGTKHWDLMYKDRCNNTVIEEKEKSSAVTKSAMMDDVGGEAWKQSRLIEEVKPSRLRALH